MIWSIVLLPAPLRPRMPKVVPGSTSRSMSWRAQKSWVCCFLPKLRISLRRSDLLDAILYFFPMPLREMAGVTGDPRTWA